MILPSIFYEPFHICDALDPLAWLIIEITGDIRGACTESSLQGVQEIFCWAQTKCACISYVSWSLSLNRTYQIVQGKFFFWLTKLKK